MSLLTFSKGHISVKNVGRVYFLFSTHHLLMLYITTKFCKVSQTVSELLSVQDFPTKIFKGTKFHQNYGRSNSSCSLHIDRRCLIFVPSFAKISQKVSELLSGQISLLNF